MSGAKKQFLDEKGRVFGRLNIIDLLVLLLLVGLAVAVLYRFTSSSMTKDVNCRVRYTLMIEGVRDFTLEYYEEGLTCFDKVKGEYIGDIVAIRSEPLTVTIHQFDGSLYIAEHPDNLRVYVDIESDARETSSTYLLNGAYELKVGSQINLNTKSIDVWGIIVSAEKLD